MSLSAVERTAIVDALAGEGEARFDEPMARHTTLRIGGPADAWVEPATIAAVQRVRRCCALHNLPSRAVGAGSNLLVRDGGVRGVLLAPRLLRRLHIEDVPGAARVLVGAGVTTGKLLSAATRRALGGVEFLAGVPGTVGGGIVMNAGTTLGEFFHVTAEVKSVDNRGELITRDRAACGFVYRGSAIPASDVVVEAELRLSSRAVEDIERDVRALRERRKAREPHGVANAGSIFKNPPGDFAGRLIEACGLKGRRVGGAEVSPAHANWIVNAGQASAADLLALIEIVRAKVLQQFHVALQLEVKVVGEDRAT